MPKYAKYLKRNNFWYLKFVLFSSNPACYNVSPIQKEIFYLINKAVYTKARKYSHIKMTVNPKSKIDH